MIFDALDRVDLYAKIHPGFAEGFDYLRHTNFAALTGGKYALDFGVVALISRYRTKPLSEAVWESHRRHIDIQYVVQGRERFGYAPSERAPWITTPYDEANDVVFYEPGRDFLDFAAGEFAVFFPHDIHAPGLACDQPEDVLKVVLKIPLS